jgi:hypothetical protein
METKTKPLTGKIRDGVLRFLRGPWLLLLLGLAAFSYGNWKFFYVVRQDVCADIEKGPRNETCQKNYPEELFKYGSLNAENERGIPYPIFYVLPRVFPKCLPNNGVGGYRSLGLPWEEGRELPRDLPHRNLSHVSQRQAGVCACRAIAHHKLTGISALPQVCH